MSGTAFSPTFIIDLRLLLRNSGIHLIAATLIVMSRQAPINRVEPRARANTIAPKTEERG